MPYRPNQPRDPGGEGGGQWVKVGVGVLDPKLSSSDAPTVPQQRLQLKGSKKLMKTQAVAGARKVVKGVAKEFGYRGELPEVQVRDSADVEAGFVAGVRKGDIVVTDRWLDEAQDPEYGVAVYRQIAHEAVHVMVSGEPSVRGHNSHMVEEGSAELLSIDFWEKHGQPYDERDAVRRDGEWVVSTANQSVYHEDVSELMRRTASKVGWDREQIRSEVERMMRGDHNVRLEFRDDTDPDFPTPEGVSADGDQLLRWYLGDL